VEIKRGHKHVPGLEKGDFELPEDVRPCISYSIQGETKTQRSTFALSGPSPQVILDIDDRLRGVANPWMEGTRLSAHGPKNIVRVALKLPKVDLKATQPDTAVQREAEAMWKKFLTHLRMAEESSLKPGGVRLVSIDDATEMIDLRLMAEFGRLARIPPTARGDANIEFGSLMRETRRYNLSAVWIHEVKDDYKLVKREKYNSRSGQMETVEETEKTGRRILDGYKRADYAVEVMLESFRDPKTQEMAIRVLNSGLNAETNGMVYTAADWGDFGPFAHISSEQLPQYSPLDFMDEPPPRRKKRVLDDD
jgi:hypothetical protein